LRRVPINSELILEQAWVILFIISSTVKWRKKSISSAIL